MFGGEDYPARLGECASEGIRQHRKLLENTSNPLPLEEGK